MRFCQQLLDNFHTFLVFFPLFNSQNLISWEEKLNEEQQFKMNLKFVVRILLIFCALLDISDQIGAANYGVCHMEINI